MKLRSLLSMVVVAFLFVTGCQANQDDANREDRTPVEETRNTRDGQRADDRLTENVENENRLNTNERRDTDRDQERYDVSDEAAERIVDEVDEIGQAYVLTSKKNAYVAATLREHDQNRSKEEQRQNDRRNVTDEDSDMHDRGKGDRQRMTEGEEVTDEVKQQITKIVKDTDKTIDNVYVSTSPDFFDLSNDFADDVRGGKPIEGFFDQIGNMIERVFPQNKR